MEDPVFQHYRLHPSGAVSLSLGEDGSGAVHPESDGTWTLRAVKKVKNADGVEEIRGLTRRGLSDPLEGIDLILFLHKFDDFADGKVIDPPN